MAQRLHGLSRLMPYSMVDALVPHDSDQYSDFEDRRWPKGIHPLDACMGFDYQTYLRDDILTKVDRATMSVGLEGREPLLDHRLAEFAARLPMQFKYDGAVGKQILRAIVHRYVPSSAMDRPKAGFSIPVLKWLRHELKPLADELLSSDELLETTALNSSAARKLYQEFQSGRMHYSPLIWRLFVFLSWNRHWKVGA
jgi:asparagine synthase (glutamine-hydrolysing)